MSQVVSNLDLPLKEERMNDKVDCKSYPTIPVKTNTDDVTCHTEWTGRAVVPNLNIQVPRQIPTPAISYIN
jgi:hypothetical protein